MFLLTFALHYFKDMRMKLTYIPSSLLTFVDPVHCSRDLQVINLCKFFFKTESHGTIHTFKNYFTTVFSVFNNKRLSKQTPSMKTSL